MEPTQPMQAETEQPASPTASYIRKNPKTYNPGGTQHVAPSQNTPATHNKAAPTPGAELAAKQQADKLAQINSNLTSDLDQMKPVVNMPANATMGKSDKNIEIPESKYEVTEEVSIVVDPALEGAEQAIETPLPPAPEPTEPDADEDMVAGEHDDEDNTPIDETSIPTNEELGLEKKDTGWQEVQKKIDDVTPPRQK